MSDWYESYFGERYLAFHREALAGRVAREDAAFVERACGLEPGMSILDLGCGSGRHAVALALSGYEMTGLDLSPVMLSAARRLAEDNGVQISWENRRMEDLEGLGPFDAVISMFAAFGYYGPQGDFEVLRAVHRVLRPGGKILLGLSNAPGTIAGLPKETWWETAEAVAQERDDYDPLEGWITIHRRRFLKRGGLEDLGPARIRAYMPYEIRRMLSEAGFEMELLFGDYRGRPFEWRRSEHQIHVARALAHRD